MAGTKAPYPGTADEPSLREAEARTGGCQGAGQSEASPGELFKLFEGLQMGVVASTASCEQYGNAQRRHGAAASQLEQGRKVAMRNVSNGHHPTPAQVEPDEACCQALRLVQPHRGHAVLHRAGGAS